MRRLAFSLFIVLLCWGFALPVAARDEAVSVTFWHSWSDDRVQDVDHMLAGFMKRYPWITAEQVYITWRPERNDKILAAFAGGAPPNVVMLQAWDVLNLRQHGLLIPLDTHMKQNGFDIKAFLPSAIEPLQIAGQTWALPATGPFVWHVAYNYDLGAIAGLPESTPRTWKDLCDYSRKLTKWQADSLVQIGAEISQSVMYYAFLYANGGDYLSTDGQQLVLDTATEDVLNFHSEFYRTVYGGHEHVDAFFRSRASTHGPSYPFFQRSMAFYWVGNPVDSAVDQWAQGMDFRIGPIPANSAKPASRQSALSTPGWTYGIAKTSDEASEHAAYLLAEWLSAHEEGGGWFMLKQTRLSPVIALNRRSAYRRAIGAWDQFSHLANEAAAKRVSPLQSEIDGALGRMYGSAKSGALPISQLIQNARTSIQAALDRYYGEK